MGIRYFAIPMFAVLVSAGFAANARQDANRSPDADWPTYNRDLAGTRYSPLTGITPENVAQLENAWTYRFHRDDRDPISGPSSFEIFQEVTPIVVDGVM